MMTYHFAYPRPSVRRLSGSLAWLALCLLAFTPTFADDAPDAPAPDAVPEAAPDEAPEAVQSRELVGWLELSGQLRDGPPPFAWVGEDEAGPSLQRVLRQLERVTTQDNYQGLVIYFDRPELSLTQINAISQGIRRVREAGKQVLTFAESYTMLDYLLAAQADMVLLQHRGAVELSGLSMEEIYLAGLLDKVGVKADVMQVGQFKGADEPLTRQAPSEAWDENISSLLDDLYDQLLDRIATGRELDRDEVEAILRDSWALSDRDYVERGVVDRLTDRDLLDVTEAQFGEQFAYDDLMGRRSQTSRQADNPFAFFRMLLQERRPTTRRDAIAVVRAVGPVTSGESSYGSGLFSSDAIGSRTIVKTLGEIRDNDDIKAAVVHINSPGGSALASEVIWQAMRDLAEHKPVFASIDGLAASGGYYIAAGADEVYVAPQSILGSIGVVGGKIVLGDLYEKVGLDVHRRSRGPLADMFNSVEPFTDEQRDAVRSGLERIYDQFIDRVEIGRGDRLADVEAVAEGRLFTGRQSVDNGLADELGGLGDAIAAAAQRAGLDEGQYDIIHLPPPMSLGQFIDDLFGVTAPTQQAALMRLGQQLLGPEAWGSVQSVMQGLMLLRDEPAVTLMPYVIIIR
ncbi:signal peptide peptidase SppA [Phycisphaerales bacterium AB-hyl4]|uniref:Signal peptide peptidase SppA n=1 Tax=Natronomicrosphaera hydrolytica TaxID=3242702 RepID=A0ABV4U7W0_9BACT